MTLGYTFNGVHLSTLGAYLKSKNRQISPARKVFYIEIPSRDGSLLFDNGASDRFIALSHFIPKNAMADLRVAMRAISDWFTTEERKQLIFDDEPDKYYMAKVDGAIDLEQIVSSGQFDVTFRCEPWAYAVTAKTADFAADAVTIVNTGTVKCYPVFTATFTEATTELKIIKGTEYVRVVKNFIIGDVLVIDNAKGTVKLNGASVMTSLDWQNSIFFSLSPGSNALTVTPTSKATISTAYRERWL